MRIVESAAPMRRCLELAEQGRGKVGTNPLVGAVLVRGGKIIAEAFHEGFGKAHAERRLLENFDQKISSYDVLYVNLEPCCHQGKTPACTDIIRERGIKHVVFGMVDPDPNVAGKGIACLLKHGIRVTGPMERAQCEWLNRGFITLRTKGRPWVTLRSARTKDGAIARPDGSPLKITSPEQDLWTHAWLRARHDAIVVGVQTVIADDPLLTNRFRPSSSCWIVDTHEVPIQTMTKPVGYTNSTQKSLKTRLQSGDSGGGHRRSTFFVEPDKERTGKDKILNAAFSPLRIVLDPHLRVPVEARVVTGSLAVGTMVIAAQGMNRVKRQELEGRGVRVAEIPLEDGHFDLPSLWKILMTPSGDFHGIASVLIEGGTRTWQTFREAGVSDEEVVLMGP